MTNGFNASVPARKPKTRIGRVLMELTSDPEVPLADGTDNEADSVNEDGIANHAAASGAASAFETLADPHPLSGAALEPAFEHGIAARPAETRITMPPAPSAETRASRPVSLEISTASTDRHRARLAALRERLAVAAQPRPITSEPKHTAAAVRELIEELRGRVETAVKEQSKIVDELEDTRAALAKAEAELERERRTRVDIEARAEEREQVADDAVAEAESLAAERDLVLAELATQRRLDDEQSALVAEAEAALDRHRAERDAAAQELADMRNLLDLRTAEIVELESRLDAELAKRAKVEARCRELESEIARLAEATEALDAIQGMVRNRR